MTIDKIPIELHELDQWVVWKNVKRGEQDTKVPFAYNGKSAKSNDRSTWCSFERAAARSGKYDGIGFVFSSTDPFCGIDLDGCIDPKTQTIQQWAREILMLFGSYAEVSPSGTGIKIWCKAKSPFPSGKKTAIDEEPCCDKQPAVEIYDQLRYFTVTGERVEGFDKIIDCEIPVLKLKRMYWKAEKAIRPTHKPLRTDVCDRARKYLARVEPSISGQGGHDKAFYAACILRLGFELSENDAINLLREWNQTCKPPWTERELLHKVQSAGQQEGERGYLKDTEPQQFDEVSVPVYEQEPLKLGTLEEHTAKLIKSIQGGTEQLIDLGLPLINKAIGGGVEKGEMILICARPSHGKSALALQAIHQVTHNGLTAMIISQEMSARALAKRGLLFASDVSEGDWSNNSDRVKEELGYHFETRAQCYVVESCANVNAACDLIRRAVAELGVEFVVVDYAQILSGRGSNRYEQITNTSIALRKIATETGVVLVLLCQLSREVEKRDKYIPRLSDLKDTGQLEQDADVVLSLLWPHQLDKARPKEEFFVFVLKNRNREIVKHSVKCVFNPSKQMIQHERPETKERKDFD